MAKPVYTRNTTVGQDLADIAKGIGRSVGGALGKARDAIQNRPAQIDKAVDDADPASQEPDADSDDTGLSQYHAQTTDRHNGY